MTPRIPGIPVIPRILRGTRGDVFRVMSMIEAQVEALEAQIRETARNSEHTAMR
jgi:hypothetical protein